MTIFAGDKERNLANTVMDWLLNLGYLGLFLGTFLAGTVLPLSSDILLVGMLAAKADPLICLPVAAVGNWLGAMTSYWLGWYAKWEWLEKWFRIKPDTLRRQQERVDKYGVWLAMVFWAKDRRSPGSSQQQYPCQCQRHGRWQRKTLSSQRHRRGLYGHQK